ncbi:hypothetical protein DHEL01_v204142 [Diaporthe helianthi]|uniref:Velvet domain-containing protein n=1 Tax=Diaporthe helianthi TaxID=158607 RepID=A0A2P5I4R8_DIAHE|nr:hypothetical protein DHEL01_v204142 [Diaporthe helianthi]
MVSVTYAQTSSSEVHIVVQPPQRVRARRRLVPPLVARTDSPQLLEAFLNGTKHIYATLALTASNGFDDATYNLTGTFSVSGQGVNSYPRGSKKKGGGSSSSSQTPHQWIYFVFPGLGIREPGLYTFTVFINALDYSTKSLTVLCDKASRTFNVVYEAEPPGKPSPEEQAILEDLRNNNLYDP